MDKMNAYCLIFALCFIMGGCAVRETLKEDLSQHEKEAVDNNIDEEIKVLEQSRAKASKVTGYSSPGYPVRLPSKVIRIYVAPMKSPKGRYIGEHYVYDLLEKEDWWTPSSSGVDTIVPSTSGSYEAGRESGMQDQKDDTAANDISANNINLKSKTGKSKSSKTKKTD